MVFYSLLTQNLLKSMCRSAFFINVRACAIKFHSKIFGGSFLNLVMDDQQKKTLLV